MKNKLRILKAFTLAEILLVFFIIGIIAAIVIPISMSRIDSASNSNMTYSAFYAIKNSLLEDMLSNGTVFDSESKVCKALTKYINTAKYNCTNKKITFANGIEVKNIESSTLGYTLTLDIDGSRRGGTEASGDIVKFTVTKSGILLPANDNAKSKKYLSAKYGLEDEGHYNWIESNVSYKDAMCKSGNLIGDEVCSSYCGNDSYCTADGSSIASECKEGACEVFANRPFNLK